MLETLFATKKYNEAGINHKKVIISILTNQFANVEVKISVGHTVPLISTFMHFRMLVSL